MTVYAGVRNASPRSVYPHECKPMSNPRHQDTCGYCGKPMPKPLKRDSEWEQQLIRECTTGLMIDAGPLIKFAQDRANVGERDYGFDFPSLDRDMVLEGLREGGDWTNYISWELDKIRRGIAPGGDRVVHLQRALRHVALAFEECQRAR